MADVLTKEESYAERRRLFKDIWSTALEYAEADDIMAKPKVIKTLKLSFTERTSKKKAQRIKNLRSVCKKILEFCDKNEEEEIENEQPANEESPHINLKRKNKKKCRKVKSVSHRSLVSKEKEKKDETKTIQAYHMKMTTQRAKRGAAESKNTTKESSRIVRKIKPKKKVIKKNKSSSEPPPELIDWADVMLEDD